MDAALRSLRQKYLLPPWRGAKDIVLNPDTGEVGILFVERDGQRIDWSWPNEAAAAKELFRL